MRLAIGRTQAGGVRSATATGRAAGGRRPRPARAPGPRPAHPAHRGCGARRRQRDARPRRGALRRLSCGLPRRDARPRPSCALPRPGAPLRRGALPRPSCAPLPRDGLLGLLDDGRVQVGDQARQALVVPAQLVGLGALGGDLPFNWASSVERSFCWPTRAVFCSVVSATTFRSRRDGRRPCPATRPAGRCRRAAPAPPGRGPGTRNPGSPDCGPAIADRRRTAAPSRATDRWCTGCAAGRPARRGAWPASPAGRRSAFQAAQVGLGLAIGLGQLAQPQIDAGNGRFGLFQRVGRFLAGGLARVDVFCRFSMRSRSWACWRSASDWRPARSWARRGPKAFHRPERPPTTTPTRDA